MGDYCSAVLTLGGETTATVAVAVSAVADAPRVSGPVELLVTAGGSLVVSEADLLANATEVDGEALWVSGVSVAGGGGTLADNGDGTWTLTPPGTGGTVSLSYTVSDGGLSTSASATVTVNAAPVAGADTASAVEDTPLVIAASDLLANDVDADADVLSISAVGGAVGGTVSLNGAGDVVFTPATDFNGEPRSRTRPRTAVAARRRRR